MSYLIFRNVSTQSLSGVYVSEMPSHKKAGKRVTEYYVKGRDGALHVDEGFSNFDLTVKLVLINAPVDRRQLVNAWADGTGKLITSDDPSRCYMATVKDEVRWKRTKANQGFYDTATITFTCQPFMYEAVDSVIVMTESTDIMNPGTAVAMPLIKVEGAGDVDFTFAGYPIQINDMSADSPVFIDCENGYIYTAAGGAATIVGEIPQLQMGLNSIVFGANVSIITVTPRWRWI